MSAFLGPIHYWLYNKIQLQEDLVEEIMTLAKDKWQIDLLEESNRQYGVSERRPLEQVIDEGNIHGWLQQQVSRVEYKLAYCITELINKVPGSLEILSELFKAKGEAKRKTLEADLAAMTLYKVISDSLLDGMPCDHANMLVAQSEEEVIWKRNTCVHQAYWEEVMGDIANYYALRNAWLRGFVEAGGDEFIKVNENTYCIRKGNKHE